MSKKKSKKDKKPNIPLQTMARPRLEQILQRRQYNELDDDEFVSSIKKLMTELGHEAVLNALTGLLDKADLEQKNALMIVIPKLGNADTINHLWQLVRRSKASISTKMTALIILKEMGEQVDLENPGEYFSWRDIKQADIAEVQNIARFSTQALIKELQRAEDANEVQAMMLQYEKITAQTGGEATVLAFIDDLVAMGNNGAADMLLALTVTTPRPKARESARKGLLKLAGQKVFPQSEIIKAMANERFHSAYTTDPAHPWQQGVAIVFETSKNMVQALIFLLDFGHPWKGAIKDVFPTYMMSPQQFERDFINKSRGAEAEYRSTTYGRARQFILDALEANQHNRVKLPPEYEEFRHLMERRIVDPSPEVLAHAAQVDANIVDAWGELEGTPVRGMEIISPDGKPIPLILPDELFDKFEAEDDEADEFSDLLDDVEAYYQGSAEAEEDPDNPKASILPYDWVVDYLTARYDEGVDLDELDERWMDLADFMFYVEMTEDAPTTLVEIQDFHLSEFVVEFWDEQAGEEGSYEEKQHALETIGDLYAYLAAEKLIPAKAASQVTQTIKALSGQPDKITPIKRPA